MRQTVFKKLTFSFCTFSVLIISVMAILSGGIFNREFKNYLKEVNRSQIESIFYDIEDIYNRDLGFSQENLRDIKRISNRSGHSVEIVDSAGDVIFENTGESGEFHTELESADKSAQDYGEVEFELDMKDGAGKVIVGFSENIGMKSEDLVFQNTIKKALGIGGIILLVLSLIVSYILSKKISKPILSLKLVAEKIGKGEWSNRYMGSESDPKEVHELSISIEHMAQSLKVQEELRKQLVSDMAHEIRTPIAVLKSHLEAMIEEVWEPSLERLNELHSEVDMINDLVDRLKDIHILESGSHTLNLEFIELNADIYAIVSSLMHMYREKGIELKVELEEGQMVTMDRAKFKQILYNLLSNAYKYSKSGSTVKLSTRSTADCLEISVSDNGVGISKDDLPHVFERFYRGEKSRNREYGGVGLGLTIVKALTDAHGWTIEVESESGVGSKFTIKVPRRNLENS